MRCRPRGWSTAEKHQRSKRSRSHSTSSGRGAKSSRDRSGNSPRSASPRAIDLQRAPNGSGERAASSRVSSTSARASSGSPVASETRGSRAAAAESSGCTWSSSAGNSSGDGRFGAPFLKTRRCTNSRLTRKSGASRPAAARWLACSSSTPNSLPKKRERLPDTSTSRSPSAGPESGARRCCSNRADSSGSACCRSRWNAAVRSASRRASCRSGYEKPAIPSRGQRGSSRRSTAGSVIGRQCIAPAGGIPVKTARDQGCRCGSARVAAAISVTGTRSRARKQA